MGKKLKDILSELATDCKAMNLDERVSFRYLHEKFTSKLEYFLRLEAKSREFFKDFSLWKTIECVDLVEVDKNICGFIDECSSLKKSKIKIPLSYNTNWGQLIKVLTLDGSTEFNMIRSHELKDYTTREYGNTNNVFWIENQYLYLPNNDLEKVKVLMIPKISTEVDKLNCEVGECVSILDSVIDYPDYLITLAKQETLKELLNGYKRVIEDEKGDDNTNRKS